MAEKVPQREFSLFRLNFDDCPNAISLSPKVSEILNETSCTQWGYIEDWILKIIRLFQEFLPFHKETIDAQRIAAIEQNTSYMTR